MTLILRSNTISENSIGNVHGWKGPPDYAAMLDFNRGEYYLMDSGERIDLAAADAFNVTRASPGPYSGRDGVRKIASPNSPRIQYIPEYDSAGVAVDEQVTNLALLGTNGESVAISAFSSNQPLFLSYIGGEASLSHANLTLVDQWTDPSGRTVKRYAKSVSTAFNATLSVSSGAAQIEVAAMRYSRVPVEYGQTRAIETLRLGHQLVSLLSGGAGTIVYRAIYWPQPGAESRTPPSISVRSGNGEGGLYLRLSSNKGSNGTDSARKAPDGGGINSSVQHATAVGNWRDHHVKGLSWSGMGSELGILSYGQYAESGEIGSPISGISEIVVGGDPTSHTGNSRLNGVITHIVIYDRMLTPDEALLAANQIL